MRLFTEDTEEVKECKRRLNIIEMVKDHKRGSLLLPTGLPIDCKVDQPRDIVERERPQTYILGDTQYTNGLTRNVYINGHNKKEKGWGFAGRARTGSEMNSGEGVNTSQLTLC